MIAAVTVLLAFPLGYFLRSHLAANTTYAIAYLWAFVFQTLYLLLDSLDGGDAPAFDKGEFPTSYGAVALAIFAVGFGMVAAGRWVRERRTVRPRQHTASSLVE
ncbi:hypothetical protein [Luteipulveratus mongoliensis]|uniref:Integral membrane protein n=1 Tax=Luteipulveratus mongoliensis TaxID=571913 RepID=A0A0K1JFR2_9MICO|nr:hypothetical protein [Luteipulveratus mongoliensis]AKU15423.1 hypothetical protein VV02_05325 [Luteipulveratus mongoliensis]